MKRFGKVVTGSGRIMYHDESGTEMAPPTWEPTGEYGQREGCTTTIGRMADSRRIEVMGNFVTGLLEPDVFWLTAESFRGKIVFGRSSEEEADDTLLGFCSSQFWDTLDEAKAALVIVPEQLRVQIVDAEGKTVFHF